jgi:hypothetical protein
MAVRFACPRIIPGAVQALASAALLALLSHPAAAASEWRYCLAAWEATHSIYVTMPFRADAGLVVLEDAYSAYLDAQGIRHEPVICPRAASEALALAARDEAIAYNRTRGMSSSLAAWRYGG